LDGAAAELARRLEGVRPPRVERHLGELEDRLVSALGDDALEQARAAGAALSTEALTQLALRALQPQTRAHAL
jgi:hypothetical protein